MRRAIVRLAVRALLVLAAAAALGAETRRDESLRLAPLAERIAKLHAQAAQGVMPECSRRALGQAIGEFDAALPAASARAAGGEARETYVLLGLLWSEYRSWASRAPTRDTTRKVADRADEVAWVAAKASHPLASRDSTAALASRAAALSQRVARLHLVRRLEPRNEALSRELAAAATELEATLTALSAEQDPRLAGEIQVARTQHGFLQRAAREAEASGASAAQVESIARTGDHIFEAMERLLRLTEGR